MINLALDPKSDGLLENGFARGPFRSHCLHVKGTPRSAGPWLSLTAALFMSGEAMFGASEELFILWGDEGDWAGSLEIREGRFESIGPYSFEEGQGDRFKAMGERRVEWSSETGGQLDGIRFLATMSDKTIFVFKAGRFSREWRPVEFPVGSDAVVFLGGEHEFAVLGRGRPERGPLLPRQLPMPDLYSTSQPPKDAIFLPGDWSKTDGVAAVELSKAPPGDVVVRRVSNGQSRLYLEIHCPSGALGGRAAVSFGGQPVDARDIDGSLWLAIRPRMGALKLRIRHPDPKGSMAVKEFSVPASLVEIRGTEMLLNGERFLVKGALANGLDDIGAGYLKSLGANAVGVSEEDIGWLGRKGFMGIVMTERWPSRLVAEAKDDEKFLREEGVRLADQARVVAIAAANPWTLVLRLAGDLTLGVDPWERMMGHNTHERIDHILASSYNAAEAIDPMLPKAYANGAATYRTPDFVDIHLHSACFDREPGRPPLKEVLRAQGCDRRPFISVGSGAGAHVARGKSALGTTPIWEKIQAWEQVMRWKGALALGASGGLCDALCDAGASTGAGDARPQDSGMEHPGLMTADRKPKLASWELGELWRDFKVVPAGDGKLRIRYLRGYWARDCRLSVTDKSGMEVLPQVDFGPMAERLVVARAAGGEFRWTMDYTTHGGVPMVASGAWPPWLQSEDFLKRMEAREGYPFLRELLDAELVGADGKKIAGCLGDLEREDGIAPIVFLKPGGVAYVTAIAFRGEGACRKGVSIDVAFSGRAEMVDEMTGKPNGVPLKSHPITGGLRLADLVVPILRSSGGDAGEPVRMPVIRIEPAATDAR